jgi:hypothetical protein
VILKIAEPTKRFPHRAFEVKVKGDRMRCVRRALLSTPFTFKHLQSPAAPLMRIMQIRVSH